jgi:hypothetical protein
LIFELVHEDARPICAWKWDISGTKATACISSCLGGGTIQHGQSDQLHFYSETVGPDWSGHAHLQREVRNGCKLRTQNWSEYRSCKYVLRGARSCKYILRGARGHSHLILLSYCTNGADRTGHVNTDYWNLEITLL